MSRKRPAKSSQFALSHRPTRRHHRVVTRRSQDRIAPPAQPAWARAWALAATLALCQPLRAEPAVAPDALGSQVRLMVEQAAALAWPSGKSAPRVEIEVGQLDPRLRLAPCQKIEPYLPQNSRPLGKTRIGLRCVQGAKAWNVYLPITVKLLAPSLVATGALPAGTLLEARHLRSAEVDLAEHPSPAIGQSEAALGRTLGRGLAAGDALRQGDLRQRQWFRAGDMVRVVAAGPGFAISSQAQAIDAGVEGQPVRARTESGRVITGLATDTLRLDVRL